MAGWYERRISRSTINEGNSSIKLITASLKRHFQFGICNRVKDAPVTAVRTVPVRSLFWGGGKEKDFGKNIGGEIN